MEKLVLFDVDGILVPSVATGATTHIFQKFFGLESHPKVEMEGITQRKILFDCLEKSGMADPEKDSRFEEALDYYATAFKERFARNRIEAIPNVEQFVKKLLAEKAIIGLLTGNTPGGARAKLEAVGLGNYFKFGAFGDKIMDRNKLVPIAIEEAKRATGKSFKKGDIFVVGDTPKDIECAKVGGVKSIAVATGKYTLEELRKEKPDYSFKDFNNPEAILKAIRNG